MRASSILVILIGLGVAGGSVYAARDYIETQAVASAADQIATVAVLVASRDIPLGQPIEPHLVTTQNWPVDAVPAGVYTDTTLLLADSGEEPRRARRAIAQGELFTLARVSDWGEKVTIAQTLGDNARAMAISVDAQSSVGGFVTPGDFVDVVMTQGGGDGLRAVTILQNIRVLGVDQDASEESDSPSVGRTVTVEVTPDQGQRLALAQQAGRLSLSLRDPTAATDTSLEAISLDDLLMAEPPAPVVEVAAEAPAPEPAPVRRRITIRRAGVVSTEDF